MSKIYIHDNPTNQRIVFFCPACRIQHYVQVVVKQGGSGAVWDWNGSDEEPSFVQPISLSIDNLTGAQPYLCKSTVTEGLIKFAPESTHDMAGLSSPLPDF
jgi:hypothetical protein